MTNTNETIADIIAEKRRKADELEASSWKPHQFLRERIAELRQEADRLEAAWKREKAEAEAGALEVGGMVEASRATAEKSSAVGDAAKLREAIEKALEIANREWDAHRETSAMWEIHEICTTALAAPPRNCDVSLVADGPADNNADKAWLAFKRRNPDAYFDVPGLLRCIDWLLAPAMDKEGETDGDK